MSVPPTPVPSPALPDPGDWAGAAAWAAAGGQVSLTLRPPAWPGPRQDVAAVPLVVVGHDYTGPLPATGPARALEMVGGLPPAWLAGLPADDPFLRLLAGLGGSAPDAVWLG